MELFTLEWQHSLQKQFSCCGQGKERMIDLVQCLETNQFVPLFSVTRNGKGLNTIEQATQVESLKKKAMLPPVSGKIRKVKTSKTDDKGTNNGIKRGCLQ